MSAEGRVLHCANCGAPTTFLASSCAYCRSPLSWHDVPALRLGRLLRHFDMSRGELLPSMTAMPDLEHRPGEGVIIGLPERRHVSLTCGLQRADVALRLEASALDPGVTFGLELRITKPGRARTSYVVGVLPWARAFRVDRLLSTADEAFIEAISRPQTVPQIRGPGELVALEVCCADSILSVRVGDTHLGSFVDARYGYGGHGLIMSCHDRPGRLLVKSFSVHEVI